jgi:hypothetical protein
VFCETPPLQTYLLRGTSTTHKVRHFTPNFRNWRGELGKALLARLTAEKGDGGGVCAQGWGGRNLGCNLIRLMWVLVFLGATNAVPHAPSFVGCIPVRGSVALG